ncbi:MAG: phage tail protein [Bacteroidota bacterium]
MPSFELPALFVDAVASVAALDRPVLVNRDPGPDELAVPIDASVALELVDPGPDGIDRAATRVWVDGALAFVGGGAPELQPGFDGPDADVVQTADTLRVVLHPTTFFASEALVAVRVVSATVGGAHALEATYSFRIEDRTAPMLVGGQATGQHAVDVAFDEAVQVTDASGFSLIPLDFPAVPVTVVAAEADGAMVRLTVDPEMTPDVRYEVVAVGVADLSGNPVLAPYDRVIVQGFRPARPDARRFDLWSMLPKHNRREDQTGDLWRFIACLQEVTDLLLAEVDRFPEVFDIERAPEIYVDLILADLGNPFPFDLDELGKRRLASVLVEMYRQKGTARGIINAVRFFLGVEIQAVTAYAGEALVLGESELGVDWILGPSSRFALYAFDVIVDVPLTDAQRSQLRAIVEYLKPAHTHFVNLIEPAPPAFIDHWELGVSEIGVTTDLH